MARGEEGKGGTVERGNPRRLEEDATCRREQRFNPRWDQTPARLDLAWLGSRSEDEEDTRPSHAISKVRPKKKAKK